MELQGFEICAKNALTGQPVLDATMWVDFDEAQRLVKMDADGCTVALRPAKDSAGVSIEAPGFAEARTSFAMLDSGESGKHVMLFPTTPTKVRCLSGTQPCPPDSGLAARGHGLATGPRMCHFVGGDTWSCDIVGVEDVTVDYMGMRSIGVSVEAGRDGTVVQLPTMDGAACFQWEGDVAACKLRVSQISPSSSTGFFETAVLRGKRLDVPSTVQQGARAALLCESYYWVGAMDVLAAGEGGCQSVRLQEAGEICTDRATECGVMAGGPDERPDQLYGYFKLRGCLGGLPAGVWTVSCGKDPQDRAGVVVEDGTTVDVVFPE